MPAEQRPRSPFDETAALAELERLQRAIEESRRQRKDAAARFDQFVASFQPLPPVSDDAELASSRGSGESSAMLTRAASREPTNLPPRDLPHLTATVTSREHGGGTPPITPEPVSASEAVSIEDFPAERSRVPEAFVVPDVRAADKERPRTRRAPLAFVAAAAAVAIVAAVLLMRSARSPADTSASDSRPPATVTPQATARPAEPAPAPTAATPPPSPANSDRPGVHGELTTIRTAWVRVTIDGERAIERELPPNTRLPLRAERAIVVRVGDAGAVRLTIDGRDLGPLGDEGEVVTRTFTARPSTGSGQAPREPR